MKRCLLALFLLAAVPACQNVTQRENSELRAKIEELTAKAEKLEADNERLKLMVKQLTETTDNLTQVLKAQNALGTMPVASPTPK